MTDYYLGYGNVMIPFEATDDSDAQTVARTFIKGDDYEGFLIMNNRTGRIFGMCISNA